MKDQHQFHRFFKIILIIVFTCGLVLPNFSSQSIMANEEGSNGEESGFLIHTDKVEGKMDLLAAIRGKVDIKSGSIEGLTIVSELDTPNGPITTQITSEGPVPVKNLEARTVGNSLPDIGGFCGVDVLSVLDNVNLPSILENVSINQIQIAAEDMGYNLIEILNEADGADIDYEEFIDTVGDLPLSESLELLTELLREEGYEPDVDLSNPFTEEEISELLSIIGVNASLDDVLSIIDPEPVLPLLEILELGQIYVDVCLEDVTMMVVEQSVENISLPDTNIKTCYKEECELNVSYPEESASNNGKLSNLPKVDQSANSTEELMEEQQKINERKTNYEKDEERLNKLQSILNEANNLSKQIRNRNYLNDINQKREKIDTLLQSKDEGIEKDVKTLTQDIQESYDELYNQTNSFVKSLNQSSDEIDPIKERIEDYEAFINEAKEQTRGETYYTLIRLIYEKYGDPQESVVNQTELVNEIETFIEKFNQIEAQHEQLSDNAKSIMKEVESITIEITELEKRVGDSSVINQDEESEESSENQNSEQEEDSLNETIKEKVEETIEEDPKENKDSQNESEDKEDDQSEEDEEESNEEEGNEEEEERECFKVLGIPLFCD